MTARRITATERTGNALMNACFEVMEKHCIDKKYGGCCCRECQRASAAMLNWQRLADRKAKRGRA